MALEINGSNFDSLVKGDKLVVIDFWAKWCGPCRALGPIVEEVAEEYGDKIVVGKCDTDENNDIAMKFGVMNIPMLVFLKNGEMVDTSVGLIKKEHLIKLIEAHI